MIPKTIMNRIVETIANSTAAAPSSRPSRLRIGDPRRARLEQRRDGESEEGGGREHSHGHEGEEDSVLGRYDTLLALERLRPGTGARRHMERMERRLREC